MLLRSLTTFSYTLAAPVLAALSLSNPAFAAPQVLTSIKPVHSLVSAVMEGVGEPALLVDGAASAHGFTLRPSDASKLEKADIIFWVGNDMETFLINTIPSLAPNALSVQLIQSTGISTLDLREGGLFEAHTHDDHSDHDHEDHAHGENYDHAHAVDAHIWLDPNNAKIMVSNIAATLSEYAPEDAPAFAANAHAMIAKIDAADAQVKQILAPLHDKPFFVFHDAYHYFEHHYGIHATGTFTINPEVSPGAQRLDAIRATISAHNSTCIFAEPQFSPRILDVIAGETGATLGTLDPLGASLANGADLYPNLLLTLAQSLSDCLAK